MHSNKIEKYKKTLKFSRYQRGIIIGTLLGDGHLETHNNGQTYRIKIEHSINQKEYVDWLYEQLKNWVNQPPKERKQNTSFPQGTRGDTIRYGFTTYSHGSLRFYGQQFYQRKKKVMPKLINKLLTPAALAIWYLDDGSYKSNKHKTFIIHTHGYTKQELEKAQEAMERLGIKTSLHRQQRVTGLYWRIYVKSESAEYFAKLITPTINGIPTMQYKLGNKLPKK